jgi:hypothetical protein
MPTARSIGMSTWRYKLRCDHERRLMASAPSGGRTHQSSRQGTRGVGARPTMEHGTTALRGQALTIRTWVLNVFEIERIWD